MHYKYYCYSKNRTIYLIKKTARPIGETIINFAEEKGEV